MFQKSLSFLIAIVTILFITVSGGLQDVNGKTPSENISNKTIIYNTSNYPYPYLTINLIDGQLTGLDHTTMTYKLNDSFTNINYLQEMTFLNGAFDRIHVTGDTFNGSFSVLIPDSQDSNKVYPMDARIYQDVKSIETMPDGLKTYNGESDFWTNSIAGIPFDYGELIQSENNTAMLILYAIP